GLLGDVLRPVEQLPVALEREHPDRACRADREQHQQGLEAAGRELDVLGAGQGEDQAQEAGDEPGVAFDQLALVPAPEAELADGVGFVHCERASFATPSSSSVATVSAASSIARGAAVVIRAGSSLREARSAAATASPRL